MQPDSPNRTYQWILGIISLVLILLAAYVLRFVLLPFVIAGGLAFVAEPVTRWLQARFRLPRWLAAMGPFLGFLGALAIIGLGVKWYVAPQALALAGDLPHILEHFFDTISRHRPISVGGEVHTPRDLAQSMLAGGRVALSREDPIAGIGAVFGVIMGGIMTLVLLAYFMIEGPRLGRGMLWATPPALRPAAINVARKSGPMIFSYVRGILIITLYATALTWIVTRFLLHIPNALVLALAVGILELIPMVGPILSIMIIAMVAIEQLTLGGIIGVSLFATGLRVSIDQFVGPIVLGKAVKIPAPVCIFAFLAGAAVYGLLGVIVAIPMAAIVKFVMEESYLRSEVQNNA